MTQRSPPETEPTEADLMACMRDCWGLITDGMAKDDFFAASAVMIQDLYRRHAQCAPTDPLTDLVERFSRALLAKLRLAEASGRSGWDRDDWEKQCQDGLLRHVDKGDPRDVAAYCAFMWHHGWITALTSHHRTQGE